MREFSKVAPQLWRSKRFAALGDDARMFVLYLLTCPHQSSAGCMSLPDAYAAADLNWNIERLRAARNAVIEADMLVHDEVSNEYFVRRWFRHNPPTNSKHRAGIDKLIAALDSVAVRDAVQCELGAAFAKPEQDQAIGGKHLLETALMRGRR